MRARATARQFVQIGRLAGPIWGRFGASALASAGPARGVPEGVSDLLSGRLFRHFSATSWDTLYCDPAHTMTPADGGHAPATEHVTLEHRKMAMA